MVVARHWRCGVTSFRVEVEASESGRPHITCTCGLDEFLSSWLYVDAEVAAHEAMHTHYQEDVS